MDAHNISLHLDRNDVSADELMEALSAQTALIRCVLVEMGVEADGLRWIVRELHAGSAGGTFEAQLPTNMTQLFTQVVRGLEAVGLGMEILSDTGHRPPYFNDRALQHANKLAEIGARGAAGKSRFTFGEHVTSPGRRTAANVAQLIEPKENAIGSLEGTLIGFMKLKRGYQIYLSTRLYGEKVKCDIPPFLRQDAINAIEKRVTIRGIVWTNASGEPGKIDVRGIEVMPGDTELPTVAQMGGLLRGMSFEDDE